MLSCCCHPIIPLFTPFCYHFINITYHCSYIYFVEFSSLCRNRFLKAHQPSQEPFSDAPGGRDKWAAGVREQLGPKLSAQNVGSWHRQHAEKITISTSGSSLWSSAIKWTRKPGHIWYLTPFNSDMLTTCQVPLCDNGRGE